MARFIGREQELSALQREYDQDGFRMTVVYGRRRIGKSTLLNEFTKGKRTVYYTAIRNSARRNEELFGQRLIESLSPELEGVQFSDTEKLFSYLGSCCKDMRTIVVIDEFPYWAEGDGSLLSVLQKYIDTNWIHGQMFLILCGSSVSFMEDEILSEKSPLYGRRTSQIRLEEFDYRHAGAFVPSYTAEEKAVCYGVTGGVARYLALFDVRKSLDENLIFLFFSKDGYLFEEPGNLLTQEFRNVMGYSAVIEAIADGAVRPNEIADKAHIESTNAVHFLNNLLATGIVKREVPITEENNKKKVQYILKDTMFRFWYRFVPGGLDMIEAGYGDIYYYKAVKPVLSEYMGSVFEDICRSYSLQAALRGELACSVFQVGRWWGTDPAQKKETDIDVVGLNPAEHTAILGECKYRREPIDQHVWAQLLARTGLIDRKYRTVQYLLFSLGGFTQGIQDLAAEMPVKLITLEEMYEA